MKLSEEHPQATGRVCPSALPVMHMTEAPLAFTIYYVPALRSQMSGDRALPLSTPS